MIKKLIELLNDLPPVLREQLCISYHPHLNDIAITQISASSLTCRPGSLFVALRGASANSRDGHDFIDDAISRGACAIVVDDQFVALKKYSQPFITTSNSKTLLSYLAEAFFDFPSKKLSVIGLTGTNGKTSTSFMLYSILKHAGFIPRIFGTLGFGEPGVNLTPLTHTTMDPVFLSENLSRMLSENVTHVIMEVSSHALVLGRVESLHFTTVGLTNITQDHLDFHGNLEHYRAAKARLFFDIATAATVKIVPADFSHWPVENLTQVIRYSPQQARIKFADGISIIDENDHEHMLPFIGQFHAHNVALARAIALSFSLSPATIIEGLLACPPIPGRCEIVENAQQLRVIVDYAHTPHALEELLCTVKKLPHERIILVFGCGGDRDPSKRPIMGRIASVYADIVIVTNDNPRSEDDALIRRQIMIGITSSSCIVQEIPHRGAAIAQAVTHAQKNDVVVIAGKGHETYQIIGHDTHYFSDHEEIKKALAAHDSSTN